MMKDWIQNFVIDYKICPFAKASTHQVYTWQSEGLYDDESGETIKDMIEHIVESLDASEDYRHNAFISFPFVEPFRDFELFRHFYFAATEEIETVGNDFDVDTEGHSAQAFLFHPQAAGTIHDPFAANYRFRSPFPAFHLIRRRDLDLERKSNSHVSKNIFERNEEKFANPQMMKEMRELLDSYKSS